METGLEKAPVRTTQIFDEIDQNEFLLLETKEDEIPKNAENLDA